MRNTRLVLPVIMTIIIFFSLLFGSYITFDVSPTMLRENDTAITSLQQNINSHTDSLLREIESLSSIQQKMNYIVVQMVQDEKSKSIKVDSLQKLNTQMRRKIIKLSDSLRAINVNRVIISSQKYQD